MIQRRLNKLEVNELINDAPVSETRNLKKILVKQNLDAYDFFNKYGYEHFGLVNGRPIYLAVLLKQDGKYLLSTIVNRDVKEQFSLFKKSKRELFRWLDKYKEIYAKMEKVNPKNMRWTKRMGFKQTSEDDNTVTYCLKEEKC